MQEINPHLVSTVIPVHNRPLMLAEAVESVLAQTHRPIEIIIVDDGSTDDTPQVAAALARQYPEIVSWTSQANQGPSAARETGRQLIRGQYVQYLDSDDLLRPRKFEIQLKALAASPECGAAYGYICFHPAEGPAWDEPFKASGETRPTLFPWLLMERWWNTDAPLFRRSVCDAVGPWSDLRTGEDWEYDGRVGALGTRLAHCKEFVCDQRQHAGLHVTSNVDRMSPDELRNSVRFLALMLQHAIRAGVGVECEERQRFSRWAFMVARRCAAIGLVQESETCLELALRAAGQGRGARRGVTTFRFLARCLGFQTVGRLALGWDRLKSSRRQRPAICSWNAGPSGRGRTA